MVRPSPWGGDSVEALVVANDRSLILTDGQQQLTLRAEDVSARVGVGVLHVTSPELPDEIEVDAVSDREGFTLGVGWNLRYQQLDRLGFRDVLAVLDRAGAELTLQGTAELQRKSNKFTTWVAVPLLALCEGVLAGVGGDVLGRAIGGHLSDSVVTSAVLAVLIALAVVAGLIAIPYRALYAATGASQSVVAHYDTMSARPEKRMGAIYAAALPFVFREPATERGTAYSVLPLLPAWRAEVLAGGIAVCAIATATDANLDDGMAGGVLGAIGRLGTVLVVLVTYYLPSSAPVEVPLQTALQVRNTRAIAYAAFVVFGITALVIAN